MQFQNDNPDELCSKLNDYLDGQVPSLEKFAFESHANDCESCRHEIEFHSKLESEIESLPDSDISLPPDFSKVVTANAESQVAGLRKRKERRTTGYIIAALGAILFFVLGVNVSSLVALLQLLADSVLAVFAVIGSFIFNLLLGIFVIARVAVTRVEFSGTTIVGILGIILGALFVVYLVRTGRPSIIGEAKR